MKSTDDAAPPSAGTALLEAALALSRFSYGLLYLIADEPPYSIGLSDVRTRAAKSSPTNSERPPADPSPAYAASVWSAFRDQAPGLMTITDLRARLPLAHAHHNALGHRIVWYVPVLQRARQVGFLILARGSRNLPSAHVQGCMAALCDLLATGTDPGSASESPRLQDAAAPSAPALRLHGLAEWARASQALHDSIAGLAGVGETQPLLASMLADALRVAGTGNGAVALLEGRPNHEVAHHIVMLERGDDVSGDVKRANQFERVPLVGKLASFALRVRVAERGVTSSPGDPAVYTDGASAYLQSLGVRSVHSVALRSGTTMIGWLGAGFPEAAPVSTERIDLLCLLAAQMSIAVELARLATQAKADIDARERARTSMAKLQDLSLANSVLRSAIDLLARNSSLDEVLGHTLKSICEYLFDVPCAGMLWSSQDAAGPMRMEMVFEGGAILAPGDSPRFKALDVEPLNKASFLTQAEQDQPGLILTSQLSAAVHQALASQDVHRLLCFPMIVSGEMSGAFVVALPNDAPVPDAERLQLAQALTQQGAMAIQMTRLAEAARRAAVARERESAALERVDLLSRSNRSLQRALDLPFDEFDVDRTLGHVMQVISEHIECQSSTLCLKPTGLTAFRPRLEYDGTTTRTLDHQGSQNVPPPEPLSELWHIVVESGRAHLFDPGFPTKGNGLLLKWCAATGVKGLLALPLVERGHATGCFLFRFPHAVSYSPEQLELLQTLGHHAALVVQLGRLHDRAQARSERAATVAERARIARDFHDTLAQGLTGILLHLQAALRSSDVTQARSYVESALTVARTSFVDVRRSLQALRALVLAHADFRSALANILNTCFSGTDVDVVVEVSESMDALPEAMTSEMLRIAQEAATNTLKHARARRFSATLQAVPGRVTLVLQDDGIGFDPRPAIEGFGLLGIKERAQRVGAVLTVSSRPGEGTRITVDAEVPRSGDTHADLEARTHAPLPPP